MLMRTHSPIFPVEPHLQPSSTSTSYPFPLGSTYRWYSIDALNSSCTSGLWMQLVPDLLPMVPAENQSSCLPSFNSHTNNDPLQVIIRQSTLSRMYYQSQRCVPDQPAFIAVTSHYATLSIPYMTASSTTATYFSNRNIPHTRLEKDTVSSRHLNLPRYATPPKHCVPRPFNTRPSTSQPMLNYYRPYKHPPTPPASSLHSTRRSPTIDSRNSDIYREPAYHGPPHDLTDAATQPTPRA